MVEIKPVKIIAFVGLAGGGKSAAVHYFANRGVPKVTATTAEELMAEVNHLLAAGQHTIVIDNLTSIDELKLLKRTHPNAVSVIAIVSSRHHRLQREAGLDAQQLDARDWDAVERGSLGAVIALADHYLVNNSSLDDFHRQLDQLLANSK